MILDLSAQEKELIDYFRGLTTFNQHRLMTMAGVAYENNRRTQALREGNKLAGKSR